MHNLCLLMHGRRHDLGGLVAEYHDKKSMKNLNQISNNFLERIIIYAQLYDRHHLLSLVTLCHDKN